MYLEKGLYMSALPVRYQCACCGLPVDVFCKFRRFSTVNPSQLTIYEGGSESKSLVATESDPVVFDGVGEVTHTAWRLWCFVFLRGRQLNPQQVVDSQLEDL